MKLKSIVGYVAELGNKSPEFNIIISHIIWYSKFDERKTLVKIPSGETYIVHITLSEFKKLIEA